MIKSLQAPVSSASLVPYSPSDTRVSMCIPCKVLVYIKVHPSFFNNLKFVEPYKYQPDSDHLEFLREFEGIKFLIWTVDFH
jgi:hypothetical protein